MVRRGWDKIAKICLGLTKLTSNEFGILRVSHEVSVNSAFLPPVPEAFSICHRARPRRSRTINQTDRSVVPLNGFKGRHRQRALFREPSLTHREPRLGPASSSKSPRIRWHFSFFNNGWSGRSVRILRRYVFPMIRSIFHSVTRM